MATIAELLNIVSLGETLKSALDRRERLQRQRDEVILQRDKIVTDLQQANDDVDSAKVALKAAMAAIT